MSLLRLLIVAASLPVLAGCTGTTIPDGTGTGIEARPAPRARAAVTQARTQVTQLRVAPWQSMSGYSRKRFPHWTAQQGRCNTRELVLKRDGAQVRTNSSCRATAGRWTSVYDGRTVTSASQLQVDHVVPLANAWRSGAARWTDAEREGFANDMRRPELIAVTAETNQSKGDQGPEAWKPPLAAAWCGYAIDWVAVKHAWRLTVTNAERSALRSMLDRC